MSSFTVNQSRQAMANYACCGYIKMPTQSVGQQVGGLAQEAGGQLLFATVPMACAPAFGRAKGAWKYSRANEGVSFWDAWKNKQGVLVTPQKAQTQALTQGSKWYQKFGTQASVSNIHSEAARLSAMQPNLTGDAARACQNATEALNKAKGCTDAAKFAELSSKATESVRQADIAINEAYRTGELVRSGKVAQGLQKVKNVTGLTSLKTTMMTKSSACANGFQAVEKFGKVGKAGIVMVAVGSAVAETGNVMSAFQIDKQNKEKGIKSNHGWKQVGKSATKVAGKTVGFWAGTKAGAWAGGAIGGAIGTVIPGIGNALGVAIGGFLGGLIGGIAGMFAGEKLADAAVGKESEAELVAKEQAEAANKEASNAEILAASEQMAEAKGGFTAEEQVAHDQLAQQVQVEQIEAQEKAEKLNQLDACLLALTNNTQQTSAQQTPFGSQQYPFYSATGYTTNMFQQQATQPMYYQTQYVSQTTDKDDDKKDKEKDKEKLTTV